MAQTAEEKLLKAVVKILDTESSDGGYLYDMRDFRELASPEQVKGYLETISKQIHEPYKKATHLKGNKKLPQNPYDYNNYAQMAYGRAQQDILKPPYNFKSTEEWR